MRFPIGGGDAFSLLSLFSLFHYFPAVRRQDMRPTGEVLRQNIVKIVKIVKILKIVKISSGKDALHRHLGFLISDLVAAL